MKKVKFNDGTELPLIMMTGKPIYLQGANRDSWTLHFDKSHFDTLNTLTANSDNLKIFTVTDDTGVFVHQNYCIRAKLSIEKYEVMPETGTEPAVIDERVLLTLAQLTYAELQQAQQQSAIAALGQQVVALSLGGVS